MQNGFVKKLFIGASAVTLALAWGVVLPSQARSSEMIDGCDLMPAPSVPTTELQPCEIQEKRREDCDLASAPSVPSQCSEESQKFRLERSKDSAPVQNDKELVMRKPCREMDDREMDEVSGGITGSFDMTQSGNMTLNDNSAQSISLSGQAQQNLNSIVNILSINSTISVMMNLNVSINSTVGTVNQGNTGTQTGVP